MKPLTHFKGKDTRKEYNWGIPGSVHCGKRVNHIHIFFSQVKLFAFYNQYVLGLQQKTTYTAHLCNMKTLISIDLSSSLNEIYKLWNALQGFCSLSQWLDQNWSMTKCSSQCSIGEKILLQSSTSLIMILRMAHQRSERWINPREFPSKENSDKTRLTCLNCVHYHMLTGCTELAWSTDYLDKDLNRHNGWWAQKAQLF